MNLVLLIGDAIGVFGVGKRASVKIDMSVEIETMDPSNR